jgi:hypothetical protein
MSKIRNTHQGLVPNLEATGTSGMAMSMVMDIVTNCTQQLPCLKADSRSTGEDVLLLVCNPNIHYSARREDWTALIAAGLVARCGSSE